MNIKSREKLLAGVAALSLLGISPQQTFAAQITTSQAVQQTKKITGNISDAMGPIIGATVKVKGTKNAAVTDMDGNYTLNVAAGQTVEVSYVGYLTKSFKVGGQNKYDITLTEDNNNLQEVVVVGYGTMKKSDLAGASASMDEKTLKQTPITNVDQAFQGKISGVNAVQTSGQPGSAVAVSVRGIATINANSEPLYVVDGVIFNSQSNSGASLGLGDKLGNGSHSAVSPLSLINPSDIVSMEVLKDASATAMYGSRGANGVIIVTTKQGAEGKAQVNITASEGFQFQNSGKFEMCTASEYAMLQNEANLNINPDGGLVYDDPASFGKGTNWFDEIFRVASVRDYQVAVSGGTEKVRYNLSAGYFQQDGIIKENSYDRFTLRANNSYKINKHLTIGHNLSASFSHTKNENKGVVKSAYKLSPIITPYDENGNFSDPQVASTANPLATLHYMNSDNWKDRIVGSAFLNWEVIKGLNFKTSLGIDYINGRSRNFTPKYYISEYQKVDENSLSKTWTRDFTWLWENILTYDWQINDKNRLNLLGGITAQKYTNEKLGGSGRNFFSEVEDYWYLDQSSSDTRGLENNGKHEAMMSYLFRANYALMDRYLLTASIRADGSSKFGPDNRWGYFPSVAAGWRISEEAFIKDNVEWLSNLKIRGSWGQIGNDKIGNDKYYALANVDPTYDAVFGGDYYSGGTVTSLYNTQIHWERSEQLDLGFDLGLFNNRFSLEFDYYRRDTKEMLVNVDVPASVGLASVETNVGSVRNSGLDFTVKWEDSFKDFRYGIRLTGTTIKNEVTNLGGKRITSGDIGSGKSVHMTEEGMPIKYFYGYKTIGIFQSNEEIEQYNAMAAAASGDAKKKYQANVAPGDLIYADTDGNGYITAEDRTDLGSPTPKFIGGLGITAAWKGFDLSIDLQGNFGNKIYNAKQAERNAGVDNWDRSFLDRWTENNRNTSIPRMTFEGNNYFVSDRYVESGNYVKLQTVELGYTFPKNLMQKVHIQNLRLYFSGNNLLYFTNYNGFTPEILGGLDRDIYPITATCRFGLNLTF